MRNWGKTQPWLSLLVRLGLAGVFLVAGLLKAQDLDANKRAVIAYELLPTNVAEIIGVAQPFLEIAIGLFLLLGIATRLMAWLSAIAMVIFISGIASAWARGLNIDCGCFSKGGALEPGQTPNYLPSILWDVFYLALAVFLIIYPVSRFSLDGLLKPGSSKVDIEGESESDGAEER
ncbi:DoxX family protein [Catelliglobosispora koreensis]|uniref:DoxX family protein n=1 Tax=Catelliglobosispora koreensis TaxID=129052 RepID=UPI000371B579|nr:MauE/DoxX family redox-associated membrane protein [Catelliglobosispora koreensis]